MSSSESARPGADPLSPLREALLAEARHEADLAVAQADRHAEDVLEQARHEADDLLAQARAKGAQEADAVIALEQARTSRQARAEVLAARRRAYDALLAAASEAVGALRGDPDYPEVLDALRGRARARLGGEAELVEDPSGGIVGHRGDDRVVLSYGELARAAVADLGDEVQRLWSP